MYLDRSYYIYLSRFSFDNPEAVNIMNITNIRAPVAEASIYSWQGLSTNCKGKHELCFSEFPKRKRLGNYNPAADTFRENMSNEGWRQKPCHSLFSVPFFCKLPQKSHLLFKAQLMPHHLLHELPCLMFPLIPIPYVPVTPDFTPHNVAHIFNSCICSPIGVGLVSSTTRWAVHKWRQYFMLSYFSIGSTIVLNI